MRVDLHSQVSHVLLQTLVHRALSLGPPQHLRGAEGIGRSLLAVLVGVDQEQQLLVPRGSVVLDLIIMNI